MTPPSPQPPEAIPTQRALQAVVDEAEIRAVLVRYCDALDRGDADLARSVYHPGAVDLHGAFQGSAEEFVHSVMDRLSRFRSTMHWLSNIRIDLRGDIAAAQSYVVASHLLVEEDGETVEIFAGRYLDRFERREGEWRIAARRVVLDWDARHRIEERAYPHAPFVFGTRTPEDLSRALFRDFTVK